MLCLNGIGSPQRVRYSYTKAQEIKGNLSSLIKQVLSGTSDLSIIKGQNKEYFAVFFKGKKSVPRLFLGFLNEILSINNHPLPSPSALNDLYKIYQRDNNFLPLLKKHNKSSEVIIANDVFWDFFYQKAAHFKNNELENVFYFLGILCKKKNAYIWDEFNKKQIWERVFNSADFSNNSAFYNLGQWFKILTKIKYSANISLYLMEDLSNIKPLHREARILLSRLLPLILSSYKHETAKDIVGLLNSDYFKNPVEITFFSGVFHLFINLFVDYPTALNEKICAFLKAKNNFKSIILSNPSEDVVKLLKKLIIRFLPINDAKKSFAFNEDKETLVTLFIISRYLEHSTCSIDEAESKLSMKYKYFHEALFAALFIRYEIPWYFLKNLVNMQEKDCDVLFEVLKGKNLRMLINPSFILTKKDHHLFHNTSEHDAIVCESFINYGLLMAKLKNYNFDSFIYRSIKDYIKQRITINQFIENNEFYFAVFDYIKKHQEVFKPQHIIPVLDYLFNNTNINNENRFSFKNISVKRLFRDIEEWHRLLRGSFYNEKMQNIKWGGLNIENFEVEKDSKKYSFVQILSALDLFLEGKAMSHCVFSYASRCVSGSCSIWSLRVEAKDGFKRLATIEMVGKRIVQVRKKSNTLPGIKEKKLISLWAENSGILMGCIF